MTISDSNTFSLPASSDKLSTARDKWNKSLRALLTNFQSPSAPNEENIIIHSVETAPNTGMLFRSAETNALYVFDSVRHKGNPVHPVGWTRSGIWSKTEISLASANIARYEIGELFTTPGDNTRLYMKTSNTTQITDMGFAPNSTVIGSMLQDSAVTSIKLADGTVNTFAIAANAVTANKISNYSISHTNFAYNNPNTIIQYNSLGVPITVTSTMNSPLTKEWFSDNLAPRGTAYTLSHTLGEVPKFIQGQFLCLNAEMGYSSGDVVLLRTHKAAAAYEGVSIVSNATHIYVKFPTASGETTLGHYTNKTAVYITAKDWFLQIRAFA